MPAILNSTLSVAATSASRAYELEDRANAPDHLRQLASRYEEVVNLEKLWANALKEPGARLPHLITTNLKEIIEGWKQLSKAYIDMLFGNTALNMSHRSEPYGGLWKHFFAFDIALKIFTDLIKLAIFSLYFVMDSQSYNAAQMRIDIVRFRELLRIQEVIIARDSSATLQIDGMEGFHTLPIRRYLARTKSLMCSDPTDHWSFDLPMASVDEIPQTQPEEERSAMRVLKDQMVSRVVNWKGHNPANFGCLQLHDTFQGCHGVKPDDALKPFDCYLFEGVFIACKVAKPKEGNNKSDIEEPMLKLRGRIFLTTILKIDRHGSESEASLLITYEAIGNVCPLSVCRMRCKTDAIADQWYQAILRQIRLVKGPSWSGEILRI